MTDFFSPSDKYGEVAMALAQRAKPTNEMTNVEWAEFQVLEALMEVEKRRAALMYARITGEMPA